MNKEMALSDPQIVAFQNFKNATSIAGIHTLGIY